MSSFRFNNSPDISQWGQYGISELPLTFNGSDTKYKAVVQNGEIANISKKAYTVLPNEEAVKISDVAAKECDLVPFHQFTGEWFIRMNSNVIVDKWKVHSLYALNEPYNVNGDKMHLGVGVHNSIDGSTSFGAGIFTFRHACANMVLAGSRGYVQQFDERHTLDYVYKRHVGDVDLVIGDMTQKITLLMDKAQGIIEAYRQMAQKQADEAFRKNFLKGLQRHSIAAKWLPEYLRVKPKEALPPMAEGLKVWDVYNDITAKIWHDPGTTRMCVRIDYFNNLHKLIPLTVK
jgi:hypothetical protein